MPNNILDESFNNESDATAAESMDEPTNDTTAQSVASSSSKLVDPASISLLGSEPSTPAPSDSTANASTLTVAGGPPNDPEPSQVPQQQANEPAPEKPLEQGDVPADPENPIEPENQEPSVPAVIFFGEFIECKKYRVFKIDFRT